MSGLPDSWISYARGEPSLFRWVDIPLRAAALFFKSAVACRRKGFERGWFPSARLPVPTVSVGNITVGGTGKTTCACWLARFFISKGRRPAVILRGYGAKVSVPRVVTAVAPPSPTGSWAVAGSYHTDSRVAPGEEAQLLADWVPEAVVVEATNRWLGARLAIVEKGCDTIILDDGFQHSPIQRDLDIVLVDALIPWGNGALLPAGLLREHKQSLNRAHALVLTRADLVDTETRRRLLDEMARLAPQAALATASHRPTQLRRLADSRTSGLDEIVGKRVGLCSAIGNPLAFERTARSLGAEILGHRVFRDHHSYSRQDLDDVLKQFREAEIVLCTSKDAVKLRSHILDVSDTKLRMLEVEWRFLSGEETLTEQLLQVRNV